MRRVVVNAGVSAVLAALFWATPAALFQAVLAQEGPASVVVDEARETTLVETAPVIGHFVASVESEVAARAPGVVESVVVQVGDRVDQGAELATLDDSLHEIARDSALAALKRAEAGVEVAEATQTLRAQALERIAGLQNSTAFPRGRYEDLQQELAEAESDLGRAEAEVASAKAELARAEYNLTHSRILAPFDGVVTERLVSPGAYIAIGAGVATLLDLSALEIEAEIPADYVSSLAPGMEVEATLADGRRKTATLRAIVPRESVATRTRPTRFAVELEDADLGAATPGASVTLDIPVSQRRSAVTAPKDALVQSVGGWIVYVVEEGKATPRPVSLGQAEGERIEILSGLSGGEVVVVRGNERLRPGQPVAPRPVEPSSEPQRG